MPERTISLCSVYNIT